MKICIVGPAFPLRGGIAAFDERLCVAFTQAQHNSFIVSYALQYPSLLFPGKTQYDKEGIAPENIDIFSLINSINPVSWYKAASFINQKKPDLVIFRFWIPFMGPALGTINYLLHKDICRVALVDNLIPHEHRPGDRWLTKFFMKNIKKYIIMSKEVEKDVLHLKPAAKTMLLRHPIYDHYGEKPEKRDAKKSLNIPEKTKIILFFGLVRKYKGLDLLIEAFAGMRKKEDYTLLIAGEFYDDKHYYENLARKYQIDDHIIWHDRFIANDDVKNYFAAAEVLALPYKTATQSGVTQVAFHFNLPVIITNVGGLAEIIIHEVNGLIAEPNALSIRERLEQYFGDNLHHALEEGMKQEKSKYEWSYFAKKVIEFTLS